MSQCGALRLLNGGGFHKRLEVPADCMLLGVNMIRKAMQKHRRSGDVLASPSELWRIVPPIHDVALDLAGVTPGAARWVMRARRNALR